MNLSIVETASSGVLLIESGFVNQHVSRALMSGCALPQDL